ncbi:MAG: hypothetical protein WC622_13400 [Pedobacter sp.]|jgi:hypothetical protein|uniref:hypothetical protein n=1 Tax=Pedobacter sp. TaxID=1411316 RepID=UPI003567CE43
MIAGLILVFDACKKGVSQDIEVSDIAVTPKAYLNVQNARLLKSDTTYLNFLKSEVDVFNLKLDIPEIKRLMKIQDKSVLDVELLAKALGFKSYSNFLEWATIQSKRIKFLDKKYALKSNSEISLKAFINSSLISLSTPLSIKGKVSVLILRAVEKSL